MSDIENKDKIKTVFIVGPTAVGKTELAIEAARHLGSEIVSADSMQIYKYMDIGSAKPTAEEQSRARHRLVDEIDPAVPFSVADYEKLAKEYIREIWDGGMVPVISGGTGLYVHSLLYDMNFGDAPADEEMRDSLRRYAEENGSGELFRILEEEDPEAAARIHPNNVKKVIRAIEAARNGKNIPDFDSGPARNKEYETLLIGLERNREELYDRINLRVDLMMKAGLEEEIRSLMDMGLTGDMISMKGIGYKEIIACINGEYDLETAVDLVKRNSRRYAKRQLTWFRRYEDMHWINVSEGKEAALNQMICLIDGFVNRK